MLTVIVVHQQQHQATEKQSNNMNRTNHAEKQSFMDLQEGRTESQKALQRLSRLLEYREDARDALQRSEQSRKGSAGGW